MFVTIINDCSDANALGRLSTRAAAWLNCPVTTMPVVNEYEAAGCLIDALDAAGNAPGWILCNVAPRNEQTSGTNGPPFVQVECKDGPFVVTTVNTLGLLPKVGIRSCYPIDVARTLQQLVYAQVIDDHERLQIESSQFRSFDFLPLLVAEFESVGFHGGPPQEIEPWTEEVVWYVDCFGNLKTTLTTEDVVGLSDRRYRQYLGHLPVYPRLCDVPEGELAVVIGSSGLANTRFLEIVVKGGSAAARLGLKVGDLLAVHEAGGEYARVGANQVHE